MNMRPLSKASGRIKLLALIVGFLIAGVFHYLQEGSDRFTQTPPSNRWIATLVRVHDGDSFVVRNIESGQRRIVRLFGIDAPEGRQPYGDRARIELQQLLDSQHLSLQTLEHDRYGRHIVYVYLADGSLLQHHMLDAGAAWVYRQYTRREDFIQREQAARLAKQGLWENTHPESPWEFRSKMRQDGHKKGSREQPRATTVVLGNSGSKKFHLPHCPGYNTIAPNNQQYFSSEQEALNAGYARAGNCS